MKINEAADIFKRMITETDQKSEVKVYENFIGILSDLKNRNLTDDQVKSIEIELDRLELNANPENRKKYFKQKLTQFSNYLKEEFSLVSERYYTGLGVALGMSFGTAFGVLFDKGNGIAIGLSLGLAIGVAIGHTMDAKAEKENRVLKTKMG